MVYSTEKKLRDFEGTNPCMLRKYQFTSHYHSLPLNSKIPHHTATSIHYSKGSSTHLLSNSSSLFPNLCLLFPANEMRHKRNNHHQHNLGTWFYSCTSMLMLILIILGFRQMTTHHQANTRFRKIIKSLDGLPLPLCFSRVIAPLIQGLNKHVG